MIQRIVFFQLCLVITLYAHTQTSNSKHHDYNKYLIDAKNEIQNTQQLRSTISAQIDSLESQISINDTIIAEQKRIIDSVSRALTISSGKLETYMSELENTENRIHHTNASLEENSSQNKFKTDEINLLNEQSAALREKQATITGRYNKVNNTVEGAQDEIESSSFQLSQIEKSISINEEQLLSKNTSLQGHLGQLSIIAVNEDNAQLKIQSYKNDIQQRTERLSNVNLKIANNEKKSQALRAKIEDWKKEQASVRQELQPLQNELQIARRKSQSTTNQRDADSLRLRELEFLIHEDKAQQEELQNFIKGNQAKIAIIQTEIEDLKSRNKSIAGNSQLDQNKEKIQQSISDLETRMSTLSDEEIRLDARIKTEEQSLNSLEGDALETKKSNIADQKAQLRAVRIKKQGIDQDIINKQNELKKANNALASERSDSLGLIDDIQKKINAIDKLESANGAEQESLNALDNRIATYQKEKDILTEALKGEDSSISAEEEKVASLQPKVDELKARLLELDNQIIRGESDLVVIEKENKVYENEVAHLTNEIESDKKDINSNETLTNTLNEEKASHQSRVDALRAEITVLEGEQRSLRAHKRSLEDKIAQAKEIVEENTLEVQNLNSTIDSIKLAKRSIDLKIETNSGNISSSRKQSIVLRNNLDSLSKTVLMQKKLVNDQRNLVEEIRGDRSIKEQRLNTLKEQNSSLKDVLKAKENYLGQLQSSVEEEMIVGIDSGLAGEHKAALVKFEKLMEEEPGNKTLHVLVSLTRYILRDYKGALEMLNKSIEKNPANENAYIVRAETNEELNNYNAALKDYNQVVYLNPDNGRAHLLRGDLYKKYLNDWDKGCKDWHEAVRLGVMEANESIIEFCNIPVKDRTYTIHQITKESFDPEYGYSERKPIKVGRGSANKYANIESYLKLLRDKKGDPVKFVRLGNCCAYPSENGIDGKALVEQYRVTFRDEQGKKQEKTLYFSFYDFESPELLQGFDTVFEIY